MIRIKKAISITLAILLVLGTFSLDTLRVRAFDPDRYTISSITMGRSYDRDGIPTNTYIMIKGTYLKDANVGIVSDEHGYQPLTRRTANTEGILQFELDADVLLSSVIIEDSTIPLDEKNVMPSITGITTRTVKLGDDLVITGNDLNRLIDDSFIETKIDTTIVNTSNIVPDAVEGSEEATIENVSGEPGLKDIVLTRTTDQPINGVATNTVEVSIKYTYTDQFRLTQELNISNDLEMFPNRGEAGDKVFFKATKLDNYDVFFLTDIYGTDEYTRAKMGKNPTYKENAEGELDILTIEVPSLPPGEYYVVLTNKIDPTKDPDQSVTSEKIFMIGDEYGKFTIIDGKNKAKVLSIQLNQGPDSGSEATISGQYLGSLNIDGLTLDSTDKTPNILNTNDGPVLEVTYGTGEYRETNIKTITKRLRVIIGNRAGFKGGSTFTNNLDKINVVISGVTDADTNPVKDIVVETETTLTDINDKQYVFTERAVLPNGYTFIPSKIEPEIKDVTPYRIQVKDINGELMITEDRMVAIHGDNFMIHKYDNNGTTSVRYPIVKLGELEFDKNTNRDLEMYIYNPSGNSLDGSKGNEIGNKIIIVIPKDTKIRVPGKAPVEITNPVRSSEDMGLSAIEPDGVEFVPVEDDKTPVIESVTPYMVTVAGGEEVTIKGSNFQDGVKVLINGEILADKNVTREGDGKTITFIAPPGKEGKTQLQVMNVEGGIVVYDFYYVKTYTEPKLTDFTPKSGNTGTLVVVTGDNFLEPDPSASPTEIFDSNKLMTSVFKLVGTRVKLEGEDINQYNLDTNGNIYLRHYGALEGVNQVIYTDSVDGFPKPKLAEYYNSILLHDESKQNFYTFSKDAQGKIFLSDGVDNSYKIGIGPAGQLQAEKIGDKIYGLEVTTEDVIISGTPQKTDVVTIKDGATEIVKLYEKTLYAVDNSGRIFGNRVKVIDKNTLYFTVPILTRGDGYYDVTVLNPDIKSDTKADEEGFFYYSQPQSTPKITKIDPDKGSTVGGYAITIIGEDFKDYGTDKPEDKSKVYINGIMVSPENTNVSLDSKTITVTVPPYPGDLSKDKETDRITVPVVVTNPDGGSASKEDGFTYIIPTSHPEITRIYPPKGSAAGGNPIELSVNFLRLMEPYNDDNRNQKWDSGEVFQNLNNNGAWDDFTKKTSDELKEQYGDDYDTIVVPVLPKVFVGNDEAEIVEFDEGYLKIIAPSGREGTVDIYLVNNDQGMSNKVSYTYEGSNPQITSIVPNKGRKDGGIRVDIFGSDFYETKNLNVEGDKIPSVLVRFGNITNTDIPRDEDIGSILSDGRATVELEKGFRAEFNNDEEELNITIEQGENTYSGEFDFDGSEKYIYAGLLKDDEGNPFHGYELIRFEVTNRRLIVERGFAPEAELDKEDGHVIVYTPSYHTVGTVELRVINPDEKFATGEFTYKNPDSKPRIINILKETRPPVKGLVKGKSAMVLTVDYRGGNTITIVGEDFREGVTLTISGKTEIVLEEVTYKSSRELEFIMPAVSSDLVGPPYSRVIVMNDDGGQASSDGSKPLPIYIVFTQGESDPTIESVTPNTGSSTGGTEVKIEGKDFREGLSVFFGGIPVLEDNINRTDSGTIYVIAPPHEPGTVDVKVENEDGSPATAEGAFTYLSSPKIIAVVDPTDPTENTRIEEISAEGQTLIKLKGSGFSEGATVIFNPVIKKVDDVEMAEGTLIYIEGVPYILESGIPGTEYIFIDSETATIKTPEGKLDTNGVIIINPDGGASDIYNGIKYVLPQLQAPTGVAAELVYDRYIKVHWQPVSGATDYEVYVVENTQMQFIETTKLTDLMYDNLSPRAEYKFIVKAIGNFGASKPSMISNTVRTGREVGYPDKDGGLGEKTEFSRMGNAAKVIIGTEDYDKEEITIDLTKGDLAGSREVIITMAAEVITSRRAENILVLGQDFTLSFNPNSFNVKGLEDNDHNKNAGVRFKISPNNQVQGLNGANSLSSQYVLEGEAYIGSDSSAIDYLNSNINLILNFDKAKADLRRMQYIDLNIYNEYDDIWESVKKEKIDLNSSMSTSINRLGKYMILGTRR